MDGPGLIVSPVIGMKKEEFWIPASLVPNSSISRAWSFRPRRIDSAEGSGESVRLPQDIHAEENGPPAILTIPCSIRATAGGVARLVLEARRVERALVRWRKEGQRCDIIEGTDRYRLFRTNDSLCLEIAPCLPSDSGIYHCLVEHETGSCSAKIPLRIIGTFYRYYIVLLYFVPSLLCRGSRFTLSLPSFFSGIDATNAWCDTIECNRSNGFTMNETTSSIVALTNSKKKLTNDMEIEQFTNKYIELEELGTGRFARVCCAREKGFDREVALKQISRSKQPLSLTRAEYDLLRSIRHDNIVRAFALFEDTPQPDIDTIVLELSVFIHFASFFFFFFSSSLFLHLPHSNRHLIIIITCHSDSLLLYQGQRVDIVRVSWRTS